MPTVAVVESSRKLDLEESTSGSALLPPAVRATESTQREGEGDLYSQILRAQAGDREALGAILIDSWPYVHRHCKRMLHNPATAEEVTQDVMVRLCTKLPELKFPGGYAGWVRTTTHRMCLNYLKRPSKPEPCESQDLSELGFPDKKDFDPVLTEALRREVQAIMRSTIGTLSPMDSQVIRLFDLEGSSLNDIAEELEIPLGTVKRRLSYARIRLRLKLELAGQLVDDAAESRDQVELPVRSS